MSRHPFTDDAQHRYNTDPEFHQVVDILHTVIRSAKLTPHEVREAAMLAAIHYEMWRPRRWVMQEGEAPELMDDDEFAFFKMRNVARAAEVLEAINSPERLENG